MSDLDDWLDEQIETAREQYEQADSDAMAYQYAAEMGTYSNIKNGTMMFDGPEEALKVYEKNLEEPDFGMTASRIRAIERYLEKKEQ